MLRIFLTVFVLSGHQIAAQDTEQDVIDLCDQTDCLKPQEIVEYKNYEEIEFPYVQWVETAVHGTDLDKVMEIGLDKLFNYSRFNNAEGTIVPLTAPWGFTGYLVNHTFPDTFHVGVGIVPEVISRPEPLDQSIVLRSLHPGQFFVRTFHKKFVWKKYQELVLDFLKQLEEDNRKFERKFIILRYKKNGIVQIWFKQELE